MLSEPLPSVWLRGLLPEDLPILHAYEADPDARRMAAFNTGGSPSLADYQAKWARHLADPSVVIRAVMLDDELVGSVGSYLAAGERQVTYWIGRPHWGKGIATQALNLLLQQIEERPLYASCAGDNLGSLRVLQKCGFVIADQTKAFADGRGEVVTEVMLELR